MEKVSIVIVNWNTGKLLTECLASIAALPEQDSIHHVVVVDNASSDTSFSDAQRSHTSHPFVFLPQPKNLGFAKANNIGIEYIQSHDGGQDHILLLNPDTHIRANAIARMLETLIQHPRAGIVGPKLLEASGQLQRSVRAFPTFGVLLLFFLKLHSLFSKSSLWRRYMQTEFDYEKESQVDQVMGAAFLIRNTTLKAVGLLDESFWIWFEEVDYCKRAKDAGWEVWYTPTASITHYGGVSFSQRNTLKKHILFTKAAYTYMKKHIALPSMLAWACIALAAIIAIGIAVGPAAACSTFLFILFAWWTWEYPEESFLTLIVVSPLLPLLKATQTVSGLTLVKDVIIIMLFLKTCLIPLISQRLPYRRNVLFAPIVALVVWAGIEVLRAGVTTLSILRLREIVLYILLYGAVLYLPHTTAIMKRRLIWFLATLAAVMALGVFQFLFAPDSTVLRFDPLREIWIPRMASTFAHPTVFAEFLIVGQVVLLGVLLGAWKMLTRLQSGILITLFIATFPLLYLTYTRAGWIGSLIGIFFAVAMYVRITHIQKIKWVPVAIVAVALCAILGSIIRFTPVGTFLQTAIDPTYASNADRIAYVVQLLSQTSNSDGIIGKGLGNVITRAAIQEAATSTSIATGDARTVQLSKDQTLVDNQYLKTFMEMGVVGLVLTGWIFWRFGKAAAETSLVFGIIGAGFVASFIVQALFVDIWDVYPTNAIFWTLAALITKKYTT